MSRPRPSSSPGGSPWLDLSEVRRPVAFFSNGHGDRILNLPALRALAAIFAPRLTLICNEGSQSLFFSDLPLGGVVETRIWREGDSREFDAAAVARAVGPCDLFLSLVPWHSASMTALLANLNPARSIGFFPDFQVALPLNYRKHTSDLAFDVPAYLDPSLRLEDFAAPPAFPAEAEAIARRIRELVPPSMRVLAVHPETAANKMWPAERFVAVLDAFLGRHPEFVAMVVSQEPRGLDGGRFGGRAIPCAGLPLAVAFHLVARADLFLGVDSCMLHVADFFRVPGVALFGPTSSHEFGFRLGPHRHVNGDGTMDSIQVSRVVEMLEPLVDEHLLS